MSGPFRKVRGQRLFASERLEGGRTRLGWVRQNSNRALVPAPTPTPPAGTNSPGRIGANWIGASKQKGIWVGGPVPLGYASIAKKLAVVPEEADIVRMIFTRYIALGSVRALAQELQNGGIRTKQRTLPNGRTIGGGWVRGRRPGTASTLARSSIAGKSFAAVRRPFSTPPFRGRSGKAVGTSGRAALHSSRHTCTSHRAPFRPGRPPDDADPYQQKRGVRYSYYVSQATIRKRSPGFIGRVPAPELEGHLAELYGTDVSPDLISRVTDAVLDEVREWQNRPLDPVYPVVFFDALRVKIRDEGLVRNKAVYVALALNPDGEKDVLGLWIEQSEGAKFWLKVVNELKARGVNDILIAVVDGLKGFPEAITSVFPQTMVQTCIVHLIRNSLAFVSWKDRKAILPALKAIYRAETADMALVRLDEFEAE